MFLLDLRGFPLQILIFIYFSSNLQPQLVLSYLKFIQIITVHQLMWFGFVRPHFLVGEMSMTSASATASNMPEAMAFYLFLFFYFSDIVRQLFCKCERRNLY